MPKSGLCESLLTIEALPFERSIQPGRRSGPQIAGKVDGSKDRSDRVAESRCLLLRGFDVGHRITHAGRSQKRFGAVGKVRFINRNVSNKPGGY